MLRHPSRWPPGTARKRESKGAGGEELKLTYIGAGSAVFARQVITDILAVDGIDGGEFALVDTDPERLDLARRLVEILVTTSGKDYTVLASTRREEVLAGSDFVVNSVEVAGLPNVRHDYEIPLKYGVDQCIGDTIGPGGIFKVLRTGPAWLDIVADVQQLAPGAVVLNYTNPMSALTLAALRTSKLSVVGLCHSVQGTSQALAGYLGLPYQDLVWECAGINHNSWFTRLEDAAGEDLYPRLRKRAREPEIYEQDPVRFEVMLEMGAFVTESSGHFSEYVPYFRKRPDLLKRYTRDGYLGGSGFYANSWPGWRQYSQDTVRRVVEGSDPPRMDRSSEFASRIVEAMQTGRPQVIHGNVLNDGLVSNLLPGGCVEVATLVDRAGLHPQAFGPLPEHLAALNRAHMAVHELMVAAIIDRDREAALHALQLDPLTSAVCSLAEIREMFDEMWTAQRPYLGAFE
jgi:alpha-galactosidase